MNNDPPLSLSQKLGLLGILLFMVAVVSVGITLWVGWQLQGGAAAINEAGRLRMQTWRLAQALSLPVPPNAQIAALFDEFDRSLSVLQNGDSARPLFVPREPQAQEQLQKVRRQWAWLAKQWRSLHAPDHGQLTGQASEFVAVIDAFVMTIERQIENWTTLLTTFGFIITGAVVVSGVSLIYAAWTLVLNPLARLQEGVERIGRGQLAARVRVQTRDEFGQLAQNFNQMAQTLQGFYGDLEARVEDKTLRLQVERERLAQLYQAVSLAVKASSFTELAQGYAQQCRRVARADACALRWKTDPNSFFVLVASDRLPSALTQCPGGVPEGMCLCGHSCIDTEGKVLQVQVQRCAATRAAVDRSCPCQSAGFASLWCLPIVQHGRVVGEIDLFYKGESPLVQDDLTLLQALATHFNSAVEGLRVGALEREAAVAQERSFLARELHDSIAQNLTFQKIQATLLRQAIQESDTSATLNVLDELDTGIRESLADVRELLVHFRTRSNEQDTMAALRAALTKFEHQSGLQTHLRILGHGMALPPDKQVQALHIVWEALSNVRKHAQAHNVWVQVVLGAGHWHVEIRDDGVGFDAAKPVGGDEHIGLRIMRERAQRIGAQVQVRSLPGSGTSVVLDLEQQA